MEKEARNERIRSRFKRAKRGTLTKTDIAREFGLAPRTITLILKEVV